MPLFVYNGKQQSIPFDDRTKLYFGSFIAGGAILSIYSVYKLGLAFSFLYFCSLITGLCVCGAYIWLWRYIQRPSIPPTLLELYPTQLFLKRYNYQAKSYDEFTFSVNDIQIIIEKHLEPCQGVTYIVPALHIYDQEKGQSIQLFFDTEESANDFLNAIREANGVIRFLPYSLEYCTKMERMMAFQEANPVSFSGQLSDYIPHNQDAFFYEDLITYKDLLLKRKSQRRG